MAYPSPGVKPIPTSILRISTLILAGVGIGMTLGAMCFAELPIHLGLMTIGAMAYVAFLGVRQA